MIKTINKPRILIVANYASFKYGGEATIPLHYLVQMINLGVDIKLLVNERVKDELSRALPQYSGHIIYVADGKIEKAIGQLAKKLPYKLRKLTLYVLGDLLCQFSLRKELKKLIQAKQCDLIHQPISVSPKFPSFLYRLSKPLIIGPMNGGMSYPPGFKEMEGRLERCVIKIGHCVSELLNVIFPGKRHADLLLVANQRTQRALPKYRTEKVATLIENAVDFDTWHPPSETNIGDNTFVYVGRLVGFKCADILIKAFAEKPIAKRAKLKIIGSGPLQEKLEKLVERLGLSANVEFLGFLPQSECREHMLSSLAVILPSVRESGGAVVLEAMALGKPVIAVDWGGPADYLNSKSGILIKPVNRNTLVDQLVIKIDQLIDNPQWAKTLGECAFQEVKNKHNWKKKAEDMLEIYQSQLKKTIN